MLLVDPPRHAVHHDVDRQGARSPFCGSRGLALSQAEAHPAVRSPTMRAARGQGKTTSHIAGDALRWIAGLDAERQRLDIKTMALEGDGAPLEHG